MICANWIDAEHPKPPAAPEPSAEPEPLPMQSKPLPALRPKPKPVLAVAAQPPQEWATATRLAVAAMVVQANLCT